MTLRTQALPLLFLSALFSLSACAGYAQSSLAPSSSAPYQYPFQDPSRPAEERITNLISLLTLDEKIACLSTRTAVPRLGITGTNHAEGLHGLSLAGPRVGQAQPGGPPMPPRPAPPVAPVGAPARPRQVPITTTTFPQAIGMAETWDPEIIRAVGAAEGNEARFIAQSSKYGRPDLIVMAPNSDLGRDPRWGRTEECYGEDPYFNGTLVVAMVQGLQGNDPHYWQTAALLKHFLANSNEDGRDHTSSDFDERLLREYYSVPFRMGIVDGGARAYMAAYNSYNGIPMGVQPILEDITVKEWGNDGIICTDGGAMGQMVTAHHTFADLPHAVAGTLHAGITKYLERVAPLVTQALDQHLITEADLDQAIRPNFRILLHLGLLDPPALVPYSRIGTDGALEPWLTDAHKALARKVTQESIVLLKNSGGLLPLDRRTIKSIAVIGPRADRVLLDWYGGAPPYVVTPLAGIRSKVGAGVDVRYADGSDLAEAARIAGSSDVVIVCVGNHPTGGDNAGWGKVSAPSEGREAVDRQSLTLEQEELVKQVYAANPRTVVALLSSFPYAINWTQAHVPAIIHMTQCSQETGNALADVLFGDYNPGGRLVETWPASLDQLPPMMDYDIRHGRTYQYFSGTPLYPFGYGLSYTTFAYSHLKTDAGAVQAGHPLQVSVDIQNTGRRAGDEVVQMYVTHLGSAVVRPLEQLAGFRRIHLKPGEKQTLSLPLTAEQTAYWNVKAHKFVVEPDYLQLRVGSSASDIKLRKTIPVVQ